MIYPTIDQEPRHPSQLYEAFFEGIVIFLILTHCNKKKYIKNNYGFITSIFLIMYGIFRFLIEFLRMPDVHIGLIFNLFTMGQIVKCSINNSWSRNLYKKTS